MKIKTILLFSALTTAVTVNAQEKKTTTMNPFFEEYSTPYEVPPFHLIKNEHFKPAILEGIKKHEIEINTIVSNKKKPTFENTILAMENSGKLLSKASTVFYNLNSANTNEEIQAIAKELAPKLSAHNDNIYLNDALFKRVKTIWDNQKNFKLNKEQAKILENLYKNFV
ncbi:MAG: peptidase M3, partial [Flavobacterium sp.]